MSVHDVMRKLAESRRAPYTNNHNHRAPQRTQAEYEKLRSLDWLFQLQAELGKVENFSSWRQIATATMIRHDEEMAPTDADRSREHYLYRLNRYEQFKLGLIERKPPPLIPQCKLPEFQRNHHFT